MGLGFTFLCNRMDYFIRQVWVLLMKRLGFIMFRRRAGFTLGYSPCNWTQ